MAIDSHKFGTQADELDFALLVDGLAVEREQKITIDLAYRFFAAARRKFIVIDAPGHEQYTANMATGASVADLALLLVSAEDGATRQTKRHLVILSMLGIQQVVLVVNKMDCVGWSEAAFRSIEEEYREFAASLGINDVAAVPVAAKSGDNVVDRSRHMAWYRGQTVLEYLEQIEPDRARGQQSFRMPVQWVSRPNPEFRGYSGMVAGGEARPGMPVKILPSGRATRVERIPTLRWRSSASRGRPLGHPDLHRPNRCIARRHSDRRGAGTRDNGQISARLFWMSDDPLRPGHSYPFKLATTTVSKLLFSLASACADPRGMKRV